MSSVEMANTWRAAKRDNASVYWLKERARAGIGAINLSCEMRSLQCCAGSESKVAGPSADRGDARLLAQSGESHGEMVWQHGNQQSFVQIDCSERGHIDSQSEAPDCWRWLSRVYREAGMRHVRMGPLRWSG